MEFLSARDQNELLVSPEGNVRPSDRLNYTINYEHEGEDNGLGIKLDKIFLPFIINTLEEER